MKIVIGDIPRGTRVENADGSLRHNVVAIRIHRRTNGKIDAYVLERVRIEESDIDWGDVDDPATVSEMSVSLRSIDRFVVGLEARRSLPQHPRRRPIDPEDCDICRRLGDTCIYHTGVAAGVEWMATWLRIAGANPKQLARLTGEVVSVPPTPIRKQR